MDVIRSAVGQRTGPATTRVAANGGASSSFLPVLDLHAHSVPKAQYVADEPIEVAILDDLVQPQLGNPAAVFTKADVQGYELQVLAGGEATLARSTLVQLEMSLLPLYETAPSYREILDFMAQHGFRLVGIRPGFASPTGALLQPTVSSPPTPRPGRFRISRVMNDTHWLGRRAMVTGGGGCLGRAYRQHHGFKSQTP